MSFILVFSYMFQRPTIIVISYIQLYSCSVFIISCIYIAINVGLLHFRYLHSLHIRIELLKMRIVIMWAFVINSHQYTARSPLGSSGLQL